MQIKGSTIALVAGMGVAMGGTIIITGLPEQGTAAESEALFIMEEEARDYWLKGGVGLCGEAMRPDLEEIKREARGGNSIAAFRLGQLYSSGTWGVQTDHAIALQWFLLSAEGGHLEGQVRTGLAYELGKGTGVDRTKALFWYRRALEGKGGDKVLEEKIRKLSGAE